MRLTSPLVASGLMLGVAAFLAQPASAQRGGYGGVIFIGEEPGENPAAVKPAESPKVVDPEEVKRKEEERKRIAEESRLKWEKYYEERRKAALDDIYPFQDKKLQALTSPDLQKFSGERDLKRWLQRTGFRDIKVIDVTATTTAEQRRTEWMTFESLADFLDPADAGRTIEGYPGPVRAMVTARRRG